MPRPPDATIDDFLKLDIRVGEIIKVQPFPEARKPAWKLTINFGDEIGIKHSSAQIKDHYDASSLKGKQVLAVVNLPPRQIGPFLSEVLTLGLEHPEGGVGLIIPDLQADLGTRLY